MPIADRCCGSRARTGSARSARRWFPPSEFDPTDFTLRTLLNGEVVQEGSAADLIWPISYLLADLCRLITLEPGDIVLSGTPANSRPMEPGDVVEVEVSGLGRLTNTVEEWQVDLSGPGDQPEVSANTLHVALAMPEDEAERVAAHVIAIRRIDHVCLRVADVDEAAARWSVQFGLTVTEHNPDRALLRCGYEPYCLELVAGEPGHDHTGFELRRSVSLDQAAEHLEAAGVEFQREPDLIWLADVEGNRIELMPYRDGARPRAPTSPARPRRCRDFGRASSATSTS